MCLHQRQSLKVNVESAKAKADKSNDHVPRNLRGTVTIQNGLWRASIRLPQLVLTRPSSYRRIPPRSLLAMRISLLTHTVSLLCFSVTGALGWGAAGMSPLVAVPVQSFTLWPTTRARNCCNDRSDASTASCSAYAL